MDITVTPCKFSGAITAPPSKSYAIRLIIAAFLSGQKTTIKNVGSAEDVVAAINCVKALGADLVCDGKDVIFLGRTFVDDVTLDCGESATLYRILLPVVAALGVKANFMLKGSLVDRKSEPLIKCLNEHGAVTDGISVNGKLKSGAYLIDTDETSQYLSGLLFALPVAGGESEIVATGKGVSGGYIDISLDVLKKFGVNIQKISNRYFVKGCDYVAKEAYTVEGDWSAAANIFALGAVCGDAVTVEGLNLFSFQRDAAATVDYLKRIGACTEFYNDKITVKKSFIGGVEVDCTHIPDLVTTFAGVAAYAEGKTVLKNVARLKNKESSRVERICASLSAVGVKYNFDGDNLTIYGGNPHCANFEYVNDHRIIMLNMLLAAGADGISILRGAECVKKSYSDFFEDIKKSGGKIDVRI